MYERYSISELIQCKNKLQEEFDTLYNNHEKPLLYRYIGCRIIYIMKLIKEKENENNGLSGKI